MNDGTVFAPGPLGQLRLSYLVRRSMDVSRVGAAAGAMAARGASTGANTGGALMALHCHPRTSVAVRSRVADQFWRNGWCVRGEPPSAIRLMGDSAARDSALATLRDALDSDSTAIPGRRGTFTRCSRLGYVRISQDLGTFANYGPIATDLARIVGVLNATARYFSLVSRSRSIYRDTGPERDRLA